MQWLELSVIADYEAVESVSALFAMHGYNGGVAVEEPYISAPDGPSYTIDTSRPATVRTYLVDNEQSHETCKEVERGLWLLSMMRPIGELVIRTFDETDWSNNWKQYYQTRRIGERFVIVPSWQEYEAQPNDVVLTLDPGMAFGTGLHPTTQLCLELMETIDFANKRVLDLGCGSGILGVGAVLLGAYNVLALDTDPVAVTATQENATLNNATQHMTIAEGSLGSAPLDHWLGWEGAPVGAPQSYKAEQECDVLLANILANVHVVLGNDYFQALRPHGYLITSGIINDREADVTAAFQASGFTEIARRTEGDWVAFVHQRP